MVALIPLLTLAKKAYNFRQSRKNGNGETKEKKPMSPKGKIRLFAVLPIVITGIALILSILCVYAGSKPGMMDDYAVFTLNTSRIGENVLKDINGKIKSVNLNIKRSEPVMAPVAMVTPAPTATIASGPTTMITMAPRDFASDLESLTSKAGSKATSVKSDVKSKASSAESAAKSKASSAVGSLQTKLVEVVNKLYREAIDGLDLQDLYALHISSGCTGTFQYPDNKNYTAGDSGPKLDELRPHVDSCESHSAINPFQLVRILYWIGVLLTGVAFVLGFVGIVRPTKKMAIINVFGTLPAVLFMGLASAVTHGIAVGAEHLVTFVGDKIAVTGVAGQKFISLTWATTVMLLVNLALWSLIFFLIGRVAKKDGGGSDSHWGRRRPDRTSTIAMGPMPNISQPLPVHTDRNGHAMF
ncbi:hypothetical protein Q7P37_002764 [Cladosporium fusiforme]